MQTYTYNNRRIVQHDDQHYDIEELQNAEDGLVWAVIFCSLEDEMHGWTPSTPLKARVTNLMAQIPQEYRIRAIAECMPEEGNVHEFERNLTSYVICKIWETYPSPIDEAEAEARHADWLDEQRTLREAAA